MAQIDTHCQICGKGYHFCSACHEKGNWRAIACSPECWQIAQILIEHREGVINDVKATEMFGNIGISKGADLSKYLDGVARDINDILDKGTPKKSNRREWKSLTEENNGEDESKLK